jgi:hypothetical protein
MADNIKDDTLDNPTNTQSENPSDDITPTKDRETITQNQETENMEVHHHNHPSHGKKTWREYFWEFLMLFLAVFCGFLAEYKLEHVLEHQHEKQFAKLLLSDLRADSLSYIRRNENTEKALKGHQQLYDLMTASQKPTDKQILSAFVPIDHLYGFSVTSGTYSQMKTSGSLRYIQKTELINNLQQYYEVLIPIANLIIQKNVQYYTSFITPYEINHFRVQDYNSVVDSLLTIVDNPIIMNRTSQTDQELLNIMGEYGILQKIFKIRNIERLMTQNSKLIHIIKEEYDLK